jgi:hypothetical protein
MGVRKTVIRGAVAGSVVALPLLAGAAPASAFELYAKDVVLDHTFTDFAGDQVTCTVEYRSDLFREDSSRPYAADTSTQILQFDPLAGDACDGAVGVDTTYPDPEGVSRHARAFGSDFADLQLDEVQGTYTTTHLVFFLNCSANCQASFTTSPK